MLKSLFRKKSITALHNEIQKSHEHSLHKVLSFFLFLQRLPAVLQHFATLNLQA